MAVRSTKIKRPVKVDIKIVLLIFGLLLLAAGVFWVVGQYRASQIEKEGIVVCEGDVCEQSFHRHAEIEVEICGERIKFPKEKGDLSQQHVHKELNLIHLHTTLRVDPATGEVINQQLVSLGNLFDNMEMEFDQNQIGKFRNGDKCPDGRVGKVVMTVNGEANYEFDGYVWKDGDEIQIVF